MFTKIPVFLQIERVTEVVPSACDTVADRLAHQLASQLLLLQELRSNLARLEDRAANNTAAVVQALDDALTIG